MLNWTNLSIADTFVQQDGAGFQTNLRWGNPVIIQWSNLSDWSSQCHCVLHTWDTWKLVHHHCLGDQWPQRSSHHILCDLSGIFRSVILSVCVASDGSQVHQQRLWVHVSWHPGLSLFSILHVWNYWSISVHYGVDCSSKTLWSVLWTSASTSVQQEKCSDYVDSDLVNFIWINVGRDLLFVLNKA